MTQGRDDSYEEVHIENISISQEIKITLSREHENFVQVYF
jgi:hypothetical protein